MRGLIFLSLIGLTLGQICPPSEVLAPCVCDESKKSIVCNNVRGRFNLKEIFDNAASYVNDDVIFDSLELFETPLLEIPDGAIEHLKFLKVDIMSNRNLVYISPRAFNASRNVTTQLELWLNFIDNEPPYERDIFDFINSFENLESIWIPNNRLTSVPDNAFRNLPFLNQIYLGSNGISRIGSRAFAGAPNLVKLWMSSNSIPSEGLHSDAFEGISPSVELDLTYNSMNFMEQQSFQTLLDRVSKVQVGGTSCGRNGCSYQRLYCDERAHWICNNLEAYRNKLSGFLCYSDAGYPNVWEYCGNRTATH